MAAVTEWNFREEVLLSMIRAAGHDVVPDNQTGWAACRKCHVSWYVRKRALIADGQTVEPGNWSDPLAFYRCIP
jgi:hypothetical protein